MRIKDFTTKGAWCFGLLLAAYWLLGAGSQVWAAPATSPNGKLSVTKTGDALAVSYNGQNVLQISTVGLEGYTASSDFVFQREVVADYEKLAGKRRHCTN